MQPSDSTPFGTNGGHYRTNGGCVSHPRRAHNLVQIIVCYNYHSAELRVRGLPKNGHWHICTFGYWYICISSFPLLSYKWGTPIINKWGMHYRTDGGRYHRRTFQPFLRPIIVQMGDALSYKWGTPIINKWGMHYRTDGGRYHRRTFQPFLRPIIVQMGDASATLGEHTTTDVVIVCYNYHSAGLRVGAAPLFLIILLSLCTRLCTLRWLGDYYSLYTSNY